MSQCKHINLNTGCHCESNASPGNPHGFCKPHYEKRNALITKGYSFSETKCQNLKRGKVECCANEAVDGLHNMCQSCYDEAKEKRKKVIERNVAAREALRQLDEPIAPSYNTLLENLRTMLLNNPEKYDLPMQIGYIYYGRSFLHIPLEQKREAIQELAYNIYPDVFNLVPRKEDIDAYQAFCEDEDSHIFEYRPVIRYTLRGPTLKQIAADTQNVHTTDVVTQSNTTVNKLLKLAEKDTKLERVPDFFAAKWLLKKYGAWAKVKPIAEDMIVWYNTSFCKIENDWLYKKVLHGLYIYWDSMKNKEMKRELLYRIFQECRDSVGMCCEGHIARLANALVGFDEEAKPQVSTGELLQQKMADIASLGLSTIEKLLKAKAVLRELNVPEDNHSDWLDAF